MTDLSGYVFEPLRESREFDLYRGRSSSGADPILVRAPADGHLAPSSLERLRHEYALAPVLDPSWAVRPVSMAFRDGREVLVLEDPGGELLDGLLGRPLELTKFLNLAIALTAAVGQVHRCGLIHRDIKPGNLLIDAAGRAHLTGFGIGSRLPRERQAPTAPEVIAGTLAYMAPEQTGRMNRSIDTRSDLYSLGVTLYEMLTGVLPFVAADPMEWIHCHVARSPAPPSAGTRAHAGPVEAIILKLLAKSAEDRYQTAAGVEADLRECLKAWTTAGRVDPFPLGAHDTPERLLMPETLYGRERDIDGLVVAFDRLVTRGDFELVLVSGYAGIGKSSLVNELHKAMVPPRGLFVSGKFDQYKRDIPYATLAQGLQDLVRQLLAKDDAELGRWRVELLTALGANGQLMVNLIPELALVIGEQPPAAELAPQDARNRFHLVFRRFLGAFATPEHPLVLFLDDLQWLDAATLELLEHLIADSAVRHLMLIGAYRDNEVGPLHPLMRTLDAIRGTGVNVSEIVLGPLLLDDVTRLLADALHADAREVRELAGLVSAKTAGNPFFAIQFVGALADEGLLAFDPERSAWQWDIGRIRDRAITENVADLMAAKLRRLPARTREALGQLACLGSMSDTATLTLVQGGSEEDNDAALREALHAGLLLRTEGTYRFLHDRVQEAAYALITEDKRAAAHLRIGRALAARTSAAELDEKIFEIVNQFDRGAALIRSPAEASRVAELNLIAGRRAKASTAFASARTYFEAGRALLPPDSWATQYRLTFDLEFHRAECEFVTGDIAAAEERIATLQRRAGNLTDLANLACLGVLLYFTTGRSERGAEVAFSFLERVGISWSAHPTDAEVQEEYDRLRRSLADRSIQALIDLPAMTDPTSLAALDVLSQLFPAAFYVDGNLLELVLLRTTNLSLEHGHADGSCVAYAALNMVLGRRFGDYQRAYDFGQLACDLVDRRGLDRFRARVYSCVGSFAMSWVKPLPVARPFLRLAFDTGHAEGDLAFAAYTIRHLVTNLLISGEALADVQREADYALAIARKARLGIPAERFIGQLGLIHALRGIPPDGPPDEPEYTDQSHAAMATCYFLIFRLQEHFFAQDYAAALTAAERASALLWASRSCLEEAEYQFYAALTQAAVCRSGDDAPPTPHYDALVGHHRQIAIWAQQCPDNFAHRAALVGAEMARIEGRDLEAMRLYDRAIRLAQQHHFVHHEGIANELAAQFYASRGFETNAATYRRSARSCYVRWGATAKVRQLESAHSDLWEPATLLPPTVTFGAHVEHLDVGTMLKASQALSSEIVLDTLIETLIRIAVEHAGAEHGSLILLRHGEPRIAAKAATRQGRLEVIRREQIISPSDLPESALHYVIRTRSNVILDDASASHMFSDDPYVRQRRPKSLLCLPIVKQAKLVGALYLENNLTRHAFTPARIMVLEFLAAQAAISLENAYLYDDLQSSEAFLAEGQRMSGTGSWSWNVLTGSAVWSEEHYRILGRDPSRDPSPTYQLFIELVHPEDRLPLEQQLAAVVRDCAPLAIDYRVVMADGTVKYLQSVGRPMIGESGAVRDYVGSTMDVTERRHRDDALRDARAELARIGRLTTMGELAASIAHEINQPLSAIVTSAQSCLLWMAQDPPALDRARASAEHIVTGGLHAGEIIKRVRSFVSKSTSEIAPLDVHALVHDVLELMDAELRRHDVVPVIELSDGLAPVPGDRVQLQQVLVNLVMNGIDAMRTVTDRPRRLGVGARRDQRGEVLIAIDDSGTGFDPSNTHRLFDALFTTKREGMGMGLSICRSIVEAHGGRLWASPRQPYGSVFSFTLPAEPRTLLNG